MSLRVLPISLSLVLSSFALLAQRAPLGPPWLAVISRGGVGAASTNWSALTSNLVAYWRTDETSGTRYDAANTNHLTDNNTVGYGTGLVTNAADFVAANLEYLSNVGSSDFTVHGGSWSISAWIKTGETNSSGGMGIVSKGGASTRDFDMRLVYNQLKSQYSASTYSGPRYTNTNNWNLVVVVHNESQATNYFYVNTEMTHTNVSNSASSSGNRITVGNIYGSFPGNYFGGLIDEVAVWKGRALTASDITNLYNYGQSGLSWPWNGQP